jgi:hypothetical protein
VAGAAGRVLITPPSAVAARHVSDRRARPVLKRGKFCFENAVQANLLAASSANPAALNQIYNVAVAERTTLNRLTLPVQRNRFRYFPFTSSSYSLFLMQHIKTSGHRLK